MNHYLKISGVLLITALVFIGVACQPEHRPGEHMDNDEHYVDTIPLIYHMSFIQRYSEKLYLAGMEENWGLADIYAHELEEISETIIDGKHMDDGIDVSGLLETMLMPQIKLVEEAIDSKNRDQFERSFQTMIQTCNQCHQASDYGLVKVTVPENNHYNQDFSAPEK